MQQGVINAQEAVNHPKRNLVLSCLGTLKDPRVDLAICDLKADDVLLLCSDGVWEPLPEQTLVNVLSHGDIDKAAVQLLDLAESNAGNHGDNLTLVAMRWNGNDAGPITVADFPDKVIEAARGNSPPLLSDADIERAIAEIQTRFKPKK